MDILSLPPNGCTDFEGQGRLSVAAADNHSAGPSWDIKAHQGHAVINGFIVHQAKRHVKIRMKKILPQFLQIPTISPPSDTFGCSTGRSAAFRGTISPQDRPHTPVFVTDLFSVGYIIASFCHICQE